MILRIIINLKIYSVNELDGQHLNLLIHYLFIQFKSCMMLSPFLSSLTSAQILVLLDQGTGII